jgi:hypothetical protein
VLRLSHFNSNGEVDWKKVDRAPLLIIGGGNDHIVPPAVPATEQFEGRTHHIVSQKVEEHLK